MVNRLITFTTRMKNYLLLISLFILSCDLSVDSSIVEPDNNDNNGLENIVLSIGNLNLDEMKLAIDLTNNIEVAGFQFDINGIDIIGGIGGLAEENGLTITTSTNRVLGFSLSGNVIPISEGILIYLNYSNIIEQNLCLENVIFSGINGQQIAMEISGECN